jgi:hypothetical protein
MQTLALRPSVDESPAEPRAGGELLALARGLYERLTSFERLTYNVQGGAWLTERVPGTTCGAERPCEDLARCTHRPRQAVRGSWVPAGEWRPAMELVEGREVPARLTSRTLLDHILGRYWCAPEAPSWTSWVAFDIDAHTPTGASAAEQAAACEARDRMLAALWRACEWGRERQPIVMLSPGNGYHVYLPLTRDESANAEHTWPSAWPTGWFRRLAERERLDVRAGRLEIYPSGRRLRAPCGRGMILLEATRPDDTFDLGLVPWSGTAQLRRDGALVRQVVPTVRAFLGAWDAQRRPLAEWLGGERPAARWDRTWGFFAIRPGAATSPASEAAAEKTSEAPTGGENARSQQIDAVPVPPGAASPSPGQGRAGRRRVRVAAPGAASLVSDPVCNSPSSPVCANKPTGEISGPLVRGPAFIRKVTALTTKGVQEPSTRHDAVLTLTFYWACSGLSDGEVMAEMRAWCRKHSHVGDAAARGAFERESMGACKRYLKSHGHGWKRGGLEGRRRVACAALASADRRGVLMAVEPAVQSEAGAILSFVAGLPRTAAQRPAAEFELAGGLLKVLCPDRRVDVDGTGRRRRAAAVAIEELIRLGVLTLHTEAVRGSHGRIYTSHYRFGSGELPELAAVPAAVWEAAQAPIAPVPSLALVPPIVGEDAAPRAPTIEDDDAAAAVVPREVSGDGLAALELVTVEPVAVAKPSENPSPNPSPNPSEKPSRNLLGSLPRSLFSDDGAPSAPICVRMLHERDVPEGRLFVLASEDRARPRVIVVGPGASLRQPVRGAWWVRMYRLRPFTPAELEAADPQTTIPLVAAGRAPWARRPRPPLVPPTPARRGGASDGALGGVVANDQQPAAPLVDPRAELAAVLRSELPADLDPDLAAVMLGALTRRTPRGW